MLSIGREAWAAISPRGKVTLCPDFSLRSSRWGRGLRIFQLFLPALDLCLRSKMFRLSLVAALHPDARERRVDEEVVGSQCMGAFSRGEGLIESPQRKIDLGERMPRCK